MATIERLQRKAQGGRERTSCRVRYRDPDRHQKARTFRRRLDAERFAVAVEHSKVTGTYVDPQVGRLSVGEWAARWLDGARRNIVGDALRLPFRDATFDVVATSPTYGNRMADHHEARDDSDRGTYRHRLSRPLHPSNSGAMQWGEEYRSIHEKA